MRRDDGAETRAKRGGATGAGGPASALQSPKYFSASCLTLEAGASPTTATVSALGTYRALKKPSSSARPTR